MARSKAPKGEPRAFLLSGPEARAKEEALAQLVAERVPESDRELDVQHLDASQAGFNAAAIAAAVADRGMFSTQRVVVVRHAEVLRESRHERSRELLIRTIESLPEHATLVFVTGAEEEGGRGGALGEKLTAIVKQHGRVENFALLRPEDLARRLQQHAAAAGKRMAPTTAALLARRAGPGLVSALLEADKLISYAGERPGITDAEVELLVPAPVEESVFTLLNHAAAGNRRQAVEALRRLLDGGDPPARIVPLLQRTLRQILQARYLRERRIRPQAGRADLPEEVAAALPREGDLYATAAQGWMRERLWEQAGRFTWEQLRAAVDRLAMMDAGTKGWEPGIQDPAVALELFVIRLCERRC